MVAMVATMPNIELLARSAKVFSPENPDRLCYTEWALWRPDKRDRTMLLDAYKDRANVLLEYPNAVVTERQSISCSKATRIYSAWVVLGFARSPWEGARDIQDTEYLSPETKSLNALHAHVKLTHADIAQLRNELDDLDTALERLARLCQQKYENELRRLRLHSKAKRGNAPNDVIQPLQERLQKEYAQKLLDTKLRVQAIKAEIDLLWNGASAPRSALDVN